MTCHSDRDPHIFPVIIKMMIMVVVAVVAMAERAAAAMMMIGAKADWNFWISDLVKFPDGTDI